MTHAGLAAVHTAFEWLAIFVGARLYLRAGNTSLRALGETRRFAVVFGCIAGAALGNKLVHWLHRADQWPLLRESPWLLLPQAQINLNVRRSYTGHQRQSLIRPITKFHHSPVLSSIVIFKWRVINWATQDLKYSWQKAAT